MMRAEVQLPGVLAVKMPDSWEVHFPDSFLGTER